MALTRFWIRRAALVFAVALTVLLVIRLLRDGVDAIALGDAAFWSAATAVLVASLNTWWAWRHGCRLR